ncbi:MAG: Ni/Fe-hydrogenase cytochrome b subunit [Ignavibacteria bacterium]|nr:MAG: Ni/Fe-hydrogenase cytochrome b subunit [Ignavibacteria bacterium]
MKLAIPRITFWKAVAGIFLLGGLVAAVVRFGWGLGVATNLSDVTPWGLWIGFDIVVGVGLAAGGFTLAGIVHIFNIKRFKPIVRPAILTAFLGYSLVIVGLLFDLGRPWFIWHMLIYQNPHSVLFEVGMCVMIYTTVLALEFAPVVLERFRLQKALKVMKAITIPLIILGILLSMLHQSSLGSLYLIVPQKMHPYWYSPMLPVFFFISAIAVGLGMTIVESYLSARAFQKTLETHLLRDLARIMFGVLLVYFTMRFIDLLRRDALHYLVDGSFETMMLYLEFGLMLVIPLLLFNIRGFGQSRAGLFFTAFSVVLGFMTNRLNVTLTSLESYYREMFGTSYFPSIGELAVTISIVTAGFVLFGLAVKYLPIFPHHEEETVIDVNEAPERAAAPKIDGDPAAQLRRH